MLSIEQARKIDPELNNLPDEEVFDILKDLYGFGQLAYEKWIIGKRKFHKSL